MSSSELTRSEMRRAMADPVVFQALSSRDMLTVMVHDIERNGYIQKENYNTWMKRNDRDHVTQEERFDQILYLLQSTAPGKSMKAFADTGLLEFCLPKCFPVKRVVKRRDLQDMTENFRRAGKTLTIRLAVFFYPFDIYAVEDTMKESRIDEEMIQWIVGALKDIGDYLLIRENAYLKRFIYENGWEYFHFVNEFAKTMKDVYDFPEYKALSKDSILSDIRLRNEPIFPKDLVVDEEDLINSSIPESDCVEIMEALTEHCHSNPRDNDYQKLIKLAKKYHKRKFSRMMRRIHWIR